MFFLNYLVYFSKIQYVTFSFNSYLNYFELLLAIMQLGYFPFISHPLEHHLLSIGNWSTFSPGYLY